MILDHWLARIVAPLACWVLVNGIDDIIIDIAALIGHFRERTPTEEEIDAAPPRRMAIFVALWKEHRVIEKMLEKNVRGLRYPRVEFFIGAYPNDAPTLAAVGEAMKRYPTVHLSVCPHDGPTSKADCLNWIYQRMLLHEEQAGVSFDMVLTHDAEDTMDPDALRWINYYAQTCDMVQIPVLALPTPLSNFAHGVYCDEFAEFQFRDMPARQLLGGFIPSNGVGTGFSRTALHMLASTHQNCIFEPGCLTEDYENGWRVHRAGLKQKFIPITFREGRPLATREFFPLTLRSAIRQRTRWVTGIMLQSWEFHSAGETWDQLYWFWRDRKGIAGNLLTPLTNVTFLVGFNTWLVARASNHAWVLAQDLNHFYWICMGGLAIQAVHTASRMWFSSRIYGWRFAMAVPFRVLVANLINCCSTSRAIWNYAGAKIGGHPLRWAKTDHAFPSRAAMVVDRKRIGEILTGGSWLEPAVLEAALASKPAATRIGEHLLALGLISEPALYTALALQNQLPLGVPEGEVVSLAVARSLPASLVRKWRVLPFRVAAGALYVAGSELPGEEMHRDIRRFSSLEVRFHLVTPTQFEELALQYLG
jgi:adsorption protein B